MRSFIIILFLFVSAAVLAQRPNRPEGQRPMGRLLTGIVLDEKENPIPYASVAVRSNSDTTFLRGAATDLEGKFELRLKPGIYQVTVSFISRLNIQ